MMAMIIAPESPYHDGTFPASGTNWDDYIKWCLVAMQNDCDREAKRKLLNDYLTFKNYLLSTLGHFIDLIAKS